MSHQHSLAQASAHTQSIPALQRRPLRHHARARAVTRVVATEAGLCLIVGMALFVLSLYHVLLPWLANPWQAIGIAALLRVMMLGLLWMHR